MKFSILAIMAAASVSSVAAQGFNFSTPEGMIFKNAMWCCLDSAERCSDACALANDCELQRSAGLPDTEPCQVIEVGEGVVVTTDTALDPMAQMFGATTYGEVPAACRRELGFNCCDGGDGYVCGDPHFQTWGGLDYDYQGACDLKFIHAPKYAKGLGLDIHIRTDIRNEYSFISAAAVKIGDNTLEVGAWGEFILNGVDVTPANQGSMVLGDNIPVTYKQNGEVTHIYIIDTSRVTGDVDSKIKVQTFKDWVSIHMDYPHRDDFGDSVGMLGSFPEGVRFARDGVTVMEDDNEFGQEWQIRPEEAELFEGPRFPQHPERCVLPKKKAKKDAPHGLVAVSEEQATAACAHQAMHKEFCVKDVLAAQDLGMASASARA